MAARSSDPLTAATTTILLPALRLHGFKRKSNRLIGRIQEDILQFFDLQLSSFGGKDFCVNYASLSLFCPREFLELQPGARLNWANGADAWLPAKTHEEADASMIQMADLALAQALPFFDATNSAGGLLECLKREKWGARDHWHLEIAFCEARLGRSSDAKADALRAIELYREDGRDWCQKYIKLAEQLIDGIKSHTLPEAFQRWVKHSEKILRLSKLHA